jgi:hypothetical protein
MMEEAAGFPSLFRFRLIFDGQFSELRDQPPMAADHPLQQSGIGQVVQPPIGAVPDAGRINHCQSCRLTGSRKAFLQCYGQSFGKSDAPEIGDAHRIAVVDQLDGFFGVDDFTLAGQFWGSQ